MASPTDVSQTVTSISTAATPNNVNLPGSILSDDLLVMYLRMPNGSASISATPTGFNALLVADSSDASDDKTYVYVRQSDGTDGASIATNWSTTVKLSAIVWQIRGVDFASSFHGCEISSATTTTVANINPASFTPSTPGGSNDYLWLSIIGMDSETGTASNGTLSPGTLPTANTGTGGAVATNCIIWGGSLASTASSIDIAAWTSSAPATGASAFTIAVYPAAPAAQIFYKPEIALQAVNRASVF